MHLAHLPAAVVFDMDGLLFDTESLYREAAFEVAAGWGLDMPAELFLRCVGQPWPANRVQLLEHYGPGVEPDAFKAAWMHCFKASTEARLALKPGAAELLDVLDRLGLPRAIATSSSHADVRRNLVAVGLVGRFDVVVAHGGYAAGKPAPDPFLLAARRLGVEPAHCLALEDSHNGVRSAAAAGMVTVMVPDLLEATDEMVGLCAFVAVDLHEVRRAVLRASPILGSRGEAYWAIHTQPGGEPPVGAGS